MLQEQRDQLGKFEKLLQESDHAKAALESDLAAEEELATGLQRELHQQADRFNRLQDSFNDACKERADVSAQLEAQGIELEERADAASQHAASIKDIRAQVSALHAQLTAAEQRAKQVEPLQRQVADLQQQLEQLDSQERELASQAQESQSLHKEVADMQLKLQASARVMDEKVTAEQQLQDAQAKIKSLVCFYLAGTSTDSYAKHQLCICK